MIYNYVEYRVISRWFLSRKMSFVNGPSEFLHIVGLEIEASHAVITNYIAIN